ncbi:hypothetical protein PHYPSEUDO_015487 [Phytophthora pseudosyringae]|uniref:Uncharacterized protein n=1 Tax=Phytophthora pseudosyringae TaxID=221518 RepID=A0A8T1W3G5_9STRA|nr:hypothetical protein PHYPSEUDO_015487 [Phytophthora pseudosyringae]
MLERLLGGYEMEDSNKLKISSRLGKLFEVGIPPVVQLCAISEEANVIDLWSHPRDDMICVGSTEIRKINFADSCFLLLVSAFARANMSSFHLELDDNAGGSAAIRNRDLLFNTLVGGRQLSNDAKPDKADKLSMSTAKIDELVVCLAKSTARISAICSAIAEATVLEKVAFQISTLWDNTDEMNQNINLTDWAVHAAREAIKWNYPPRVFEESDRKDKASSERYGVVDLAAGSTLFPSLIVSKVHSNLALAGGHRCQARYDPAVDSKAHVVVPGYGVCEVEIGDGVNVFQASEKPEWNTRLPSSDRIYALELHFDDSEDDEVLASLFEVIGPGARTLTMEARWNDKRPRVLFYCLADCCPQLEELYLKGFDISFIDMMDEGVDVWGIKKLVFDDVIEVIGLLETLNDADVRMSRELVELELNLSSESTVTPKYLAALKAHNGKCLPLTKAKFPVTSKAAMISAVESGDQVKGPNSKSRAVHQLDSTLLGLIRVCGNT